MSQERLCIHISLKVKSVNVKQKKKIIYQAILLHGRFSAREIENNI